MNNAKMFSAGRGIGAGLVATLALSAALLLKQALGVMPQLDLVMILARALGYESAAAGWIANFVIGSLLWGPLFSWADRHMFFPHWINGLLFSSVVWLGVMLLVLPMSGEGAFGIALGVATPTLTLFLHWVYGVTLGIVYGAWKPGLWTQVHHRLHHA